MAKGTLQVALRTLRWEDYPGLSGWPNLIARDVMMETKFGVMRGHEPRNVAASRRWKGKEIGSPQPLPQECSPVDTLILAQGDPHWTLTSRTVT